MDVFIAGGDRRNAHLVRLLRAGGLDARAAGLEKCALEGVLHAPLAAAADADVYVLDEVTDAAQAGAFSIETLLKRLEALRGRGEVILTGHEVPDALLDRADYITRMQKLRHPYDHGIRARRGIEY